MRALAVVAAIVTLGVQSAAQPQIDLATVARIKQEALSSSQVMEHVGWLSDVYGPRVTGTPQLEQASEWAMKQFTAWGLARVHQERFPFGQGWRVERFAATLIEPQTQPIIGFPRNYSPSTSGPITAEVVRVDIRSDADFAKYAGKLRGRIVLPQPVRAVRMLQDRVVLQMNPQDLGEASTTPVPRPAPPAAARPGAAQRPTLAERIAQFYVAEGVAALLERGSDSDLAAGGSDLTWQTQRTDGGTVFPGTGGSRDPNVAPGVPSATIAVEHYNRILRILDKGVPAKVELNIQTRFYPETVAGGNGINTLAEIPGADLANEVVILGAHLDSHAYAAGATDNATGVSAMMEVARIITRLELRPRRTIRIALWGGEEQGLLGSRAYVNTHFGNPAEGTATPAHAQVAAYFNLDNGTGRIRGIWGQGNLGAMRLFEDWTATVKDLGVDLVSPRSVTATDHVSFDSVGLPGFQFVQERLEYNSRTHHSNMDFVDRIQRDDLVQQAAVAAVFAWYAANVPQPLPRKMPPSKQ